jgi:DNA-binding NarL/FixJ family response regulator
MKGYEVARELRAQHNDVSILVLSTCNDDHFIEEIFQSGINAYINKSDAPTKILDAVGRVFGRYRHLGWQPFGLAKN